MERQWARSWDGEWSSRWSEISSSIGNKGRDYYRQDRLRSLGIMTVWCIRMESILSSTLHVWRVITSSFCITQPICVGKLWPASVYVWIGCLWRISVLFGLPLTGSWEKSGSSRLLGLPLQTWLLCTPDADLFSLSLCILLNALFIYISYAYSLIPFVQLKENSLIGYLHYSIKTLYWVQLKKNNQRDSFPLISETFHYQLPFPSLLLLISFIHYPFHVLIYFPVHAISVISIFILSSPLLLPSINTFISRSHQTHLEHT
jgi:hypothetical protein